jgi:hypothetical protein
MRNLFPRRQIISVSTSGAVFAAPVHRQTGIHLTGRRVGAGAAVAMPTSNLLSDLCDVTGLRQQKWHGWTRDRCRRRVFVFNTGNHHAFGL